jgi:ribosomal protein S18 acetylase RimI-like enzyme
VIVMPAVNLRPADTTDVGFLLELFRDSRGAEFELMPLDPAALTDLTGMQFAAQQTHYRNTYPDSIDHVVDLAGHPVGRCRIDHNADRIRVLDIAVLTSQRRRRVATTVLTALCDEAKATGRAVRLSAWQANAPALQLYEALGFTERGNADGYAELEWSQAPGITA